MNSIRQLIARQNRADELRVAGVHHIDCHFFYSLFCGRRFAINDCPTLLGEMIAKYVRRKLMRKILLAATAAVCVGGVASAQGVSLSGEGKLGVSYVKGAANEFSALSSAKVTFTLSGDSDHDLFGGPFGASFSVNANDKDADTDEVGNYSVYVGAADGMIGRIEAGTDLGAADKKSGGLTDPGLNGIGLDDIAERYYGGSGKTLRYEKSLALLPTTVAFSLDLQNNWAIGAEYEFTDQLTIGGGYDQNEDGVNTRNTLSLGAIANLGPMKAAFLYSRRETSVPAGQTAIANQTGYGLEVGYTLGNAELIAIYAKNDGYTKDDNTVVVSESGYGVGLNYDLGGGLSFKSGYGRVNGTDKANAGFLMTF